VIELAIGGQLIEEGATVVISETEPLRLAVRGELGDSGLYLGGRAVPLERDGFRLVASKDWVDDQKTRHFVGRSPIEIRNGQAVALRAVIERRPSRVTVEQFKWMLDWFGDRTSTSNLRQDEARAQIWAEFSPRVPSPEDEGLIRLVLLWGRTAEGFRTTMTHPTSSLRSASERVPIHRVRGAMARRLSHRSIPHHDPPRPIGRPEWGSVIVDAIVDEVDTPENRFVRSVAEEFVRQLDHALRIRDGDDEITERALHARSELAILQARARQLGVGTGPRPHQSFVLRDDPRYAAVAFADQALRMASAVELTFPPIDTLKALPIEIGSLNFLYERWITTMALEWIESRCGSIERPPVPPQGSWEWSRNDEWITARVDEPYPRSGRSRVICPEGKNRPDFAMEVFARNRTKMVVVDATWSRNTSYHEEKLGYARNFIDMGSRYSELTRSRRLACVATAVAFPGPRLTVKELHAGFGLALLSLPPSDEAVTVFGQWMDEVSPF